MPAQEQNIITGTTARAIATSLERAIAVGQLQAGAPLPPVRALAAELSVSPATVAAAYRDLKGRGLVLARSRQGVQVAPRPPLPTPLWDPVPEGTRDLASGSPDPALLPRLPVGDVQDPYTPPRLYGEETNLPGLLALAARQFAADGVDATALAVVSGAMDGVERVLMAHLRPGDAVALEDPGYTAVLDLVRALGLEVVPVAVDEAGMVPEGLASALARGTRAVLLTPRAQNPTGAALDAERATQLGETLAAHPDVLVVEDDHAGPVAGVPYHSVTKGRGLWAIVRSVAKSLGPDLRLAVLTGDARTVARVEGRQQLGPGWVSHVLQRIVLGLWSDSRVQRLLDTAARMYRARAQGLVAALAQEGIPATGRSGLTVWVPVPEEHPVVSGLGQRGWAVRGGERYRIASPPAIRVTTALLPEDLTSRFAADLVAVLRPPLAAGHTRTG